MKKDITIAIKRSTYFSGALDANNKLYSIIVSDIVILELAFTFPVFDLCVLTISHWKSIFHNLSKSLLKYSGLKYFINFSFLFGFISASNLSGYKLSAIKL